MQCAQNKVIRLILSKNLFYNIDEKDFQALGILNISNGAKQLELNHVFNMNHGLWPAYLDYKLTRISQVHNYNTKSIVNIICIFTETTAQIQVHFTDNIKEHLLHNKNL